MLVLKDVIGSFEPVTLNEMDSVKLLDRTDTKFIFHASRLPEILNMMKENYRMLEINSIRNNQYETLYYDTDKFELYLRHHNEKNNRYKIRYRKYVNSDLHFFEIKFKNNKDRTIKSRVQQQGLIEGISDTAKSLLEEMTNYTSDMLKPVFWVNYSRMTLVSKGFEERLTIDTGLTFKNNSKTCSYDQLVIAELKQEKACMKSPFARAMSNAHIHENSISKYCLGVTQLISAIKKNNFKPKLLTLNKVLKNGIA